MKKIYSYRTNWLFHFLLLTIVSMSVFWEFIPTDHDFYFFKVIFRTIHAYVKRKEETRCLFDKLSLLPSQPSHFPTLWSPLRTIRWHIKHSQYFLCMLYTCTYRYIFMCIYYVTVLREHTLDISVDVCDFIPHVIYQRHLSILVPRSSSFFLIGNFAGKKLIYCLPMSFQVISSFLLWRIMLQGTLSVPKCVCVQHVCVHLCARVVIKDGTNIYWVITLCQVLFKAPRILNHLIFAIKS